MSLNAQHSFSTYEQEFLVTSMVCLAANFFSTAAKHVKNLELPAGQQNLFVELGRKVNFYQYNYAKILIEDISNQPYIYITHYCRIEPQTFQKMYKRNIGIGWDHFKQLDKFYFQDTDTAIKNPAWGNIKAAVF